MQSSLPIRRKPPRLVLAAIASLFAASACDLGPCPDQTSPPKGSCTCTDGTAIQASECDACDGTGPVNLGSVTDASQSGTILSACERSFDFNLAANSTLTFELSHLGDSVSAALEFAAGGQIAPLTVAKGSEGTLTHNLPAGAYRILLHAASAAETSFRLTLHAEAHGEDPYPEPGTLQDEALPIGTLDGLVTLPGYVGSGDPADYYSFVVPENATFTYALTNAVGNVRAQLFPFASIIDESHPYDYIDASTGVSATRSFALERGSYYLRIIPNGMDSLYELRVSSERYEPPEPDPEPSDDWMYALELGKIGDSRQDIGGFVGGTDQSDFYRFELAGNGTLTYSLNDVNGRVRAALYDDKTQIDPASPSGMIDSAAGGVTASVTEPAATYYIRVTSLDARPALYTLSLSAGKAQP